MKVKIKCWKGVATWLWVANDENCGICRMAFNGCCPDCKVPGNDCPLVWGQCSHCFHMHCILKWPRGSSRSEPCAGRCAGTGSAPGQAPPLPSPPYSGNQALVLHWEQGCLPFG
ncbi:Anaphase-promoting complex subunit 11 [Lemmus lemmus]